MSQAERLESRMLLSAGQPDPSFGDGGVVEFDPTPQLEIVSLFARTTGGKLLIAGPAEHVSGEPFVMRLNADGSPDETFGPGGKKSIALPPTWRSTPTATSS